MSMSLDSGADIPDPTERQSYGLQARNIDAGFNTGGDRDVGFEGVLSDLLGEDIGPEKDMAWLVHAVEFRWHFVHEDEDNVPSQWIDFCAELSASDELNGLPLRGGDLPDRTGDIETTNGDVPAFDAQAYQSDDVYYRVIDKSSMYWNSVANGNGAAPAGEFGGHEVWHPPRPEFIRDDDDLNLHFGILNPNDSQADNELQVTIELTFYYDEYELEQPRVVDVRTA